MKKIEYPIGVDLNNFETTYYKILSKKHLLKINNLLKNVPFGGKILTFEELVRLPFEDLIAFSPQIKAYSDNLDITDKVTGVKTNAFADLFDYKGNQPKLANFFMTQKIASLKSCHYCSIDYISSFVDFPDYKSDTEFINKASKYELQYIKDLDETTANKIILGRGVSGYSNINVIPASIEIIDIIKEIPFSNSHNHFTLDHFLPQKSHKFYSLCLYNLVPSCYSCNTKFKNEIEFEIDNDLVYISPTSKDYSLFENFTFDILFSNRLDKVKTESEITLQNKISNYEKHIQKYLRMFKIMGRYIYHKDEILKLIEKKVKYSETRIEELSKYTGLSKKELYKLIFGEELFNDDMKNNPLVKFKKDIAKKIKILT